MTAKKVFLNEIDSTLFHMIDELAKRQPAWNLTKNEDEADLSLHLGAMGFKFPIRIGEVIDKISYELSGRGRFAPSDDDRHIGPFILTGDGNFIYHTESDAKAALTDKEYLILKSLADHMDQGLDRQALLSLVWGYASSVETHTIETHMYRLRQKLEQDFGNHIEISNINGIYRLKLS